ncbi:MAG: chorismate-binding protein [Phycisphaerales bacterium JB039]
MLGPSRNEFMDLATGAVARGPQAIAIPLADAILSDQLTPALAYRRLVAPDERTAPSFLLESVEGGQRQGRYSILGASPVIEVVARRDQLAIVDRVGGAERVSVRVTVDPLAELRQLAAGVRLVLPPNPPRRIPAPARGGWFGYAGYDTVRYAEPGKLPWAGAPADDRNLPDLSFAFYDGVIVFDHVDTLCFVGQLGIVRPGEDPGACYDRALAKLEARMNAIQSHSKRLPAGRFDANPPRGLAESNLTPARHREMVEQAREYILAGDIFQVVIGQRFARTSSADPFDVYRALRVVNPSPYMVYMQAPGWPQSAPALDGAEPAQGAILVASSPEILCRVERDPAGRLIMTNRPLAGTRRRGATQAEDVALEAELLADDKERAEHIMLVDLGRNDVGKVCRPGSITLDSVMTVERYSHVMHISSTVTGELAAGADAFDALRAALPVGTVSGAPKIRAMQIIDELEPNLRGPYGGGMGYIGLDGQMDIALALRTMVVPIGLRDAASGAWTYHLQAAGGIVADSQPEAEFAETVNKAAALGRAIDLAEGAFATT